jgi:imidazolonepropionase-like amidohydrolase
VALGPADDPAQAVCGRVAAGARVVKVILTGSVDLARGTVAPPHFTFAELQKMTNAAHELGVPVAVHANGADAVRMAAEAGADSIEHGILLDAHALDLLAERDVVWVPTLTPLHALAAQADTRAGREGGVSGPRGPRGRRARPVGDERAGDLAALPRIIAEHEAMVARAHSVGVRIAAGTDGGSPGVPHGALLTEVAHLRAAGLSPAEVRDAACAVGADLLGLGGGYGRLCIGAATDLAWFGHDPFGDPPTDGGRTALLLGVLMGPPRGS